jgi:AcrR family transcriptional regulator
VAGRKTFQAQASELEEGDILNPSPMGRRERNKQEKRVRIVAAARQLFRDRGFAETTTQQIAELADIGTGTLFLYARSKEDLLVMVFRDEMIETAKAAFARPSKAPLLDQLVDIFSSMLDYHARDTELARILLKEIMFPDAAGKQADITELLEVIYAGLADLVTKAVRAGQCRQTANPRRVAENLFANYYMDLLGWLGGRTSRPQFLHQLRLHLAITISSDI